VLVHRRGASPSPAQELSTPVATESRWWDSRPLLSFPIVITHIDVARGRKKSNVSGPDLGLPEGMQVSEPVAVRRTEAYGRCDGISQIRPTIR
jgi:hypothetical protein